MSRLKVFFLNEILKPAHMYVLLRYDRCLSDVDGCSFWTKPFISRPIRRLVPFYWHLGCVFFVAFTTLKHRTQIRHYLLLKQNYTQTDTHIVKISNVLSARSFTASLFLRLGHLYIHYTENNYSYHIINCIVLGNTM